MIAQDKSPTAQVVLAAVEFLQDLHDRGTEPTAARSLLRHIRKEHPGIQFELVGDEEAFSHSFHYDLLLRFSEQESISLSYCHDGGVPWAMQGARRWTERDLLRVNHVVLRVDDALGCMEFDWNDTSSMQALVDVCILRESLEREPVEVLSDELQAALDVFRRQRGLLRASDTHAWLEDRGMSHSQLEGIAFQRAMVKKFRSQIVSEEVSPYFRDHSAEFDAAAVAMILYQERAAAQDDIERIHQGMCGFYDAAERALLSAIDARPGDTHTAATFARLRRGSLPPEVATTVFSARPHQLVGPLRIGDRWAAIRLLAVAPATLDNPTRKMIETTLFDRWLERQRGTAEIEWYWGNTTQTGGQSL